VWLLEIGCRHGVVVSLICPTLSAGRIVTIDRSKAMIDQAAPLSLPPAASAAAWKASTVACPPRRRPRGAEQSARPDEEVDALERSPADRALDLNLLDPERRERLSVEALLASKSRTGSVRSSVSHPPVQTCSVPLESLARPSSSCLGGALLGQWAYPRGGDSRASAIWKLMLRDHPVPPPSRPEEAQCWGIESEAAVRLARGRADRGCRCVVALLGA
jgi:hypothetical protein